MRPSMKYYYSTVDGVVLHHSGIVETNFMEEITLYYTRGNDVAEVVLPHYCFTKVRGFSEDDVFELEEYARNNAPLIWELALEYRATDKNNN